MNEHQFIYGGERLKELAEKLSMDEDTLVHVLYHIQDLKEFYEWVNAGEYVNQRKWER